MGIPVTWDMVPYDVQLIGGIVLHQGKIAEMATGEGKTLVATLPLYLNALTGQRRPPGHGQRLPRPARHASGWGRSTSSSASPSAASSSGMDPPERREQYDCDITYGTNNEFGFDYLRDNMAVRPEHRVQRGFVYAIVDEVDSILIDEARTPLIISGPVEHSDQAVRRAEAAGRARWCRRRLNWVSQTLAEAEKLLQDPTSSRTRPGSSCSRSSAAAPKHKRFMKLLAEQPALKKLINSDRARRTCATSACTSSTRSCSS